MSSGEAEAEDCSDGSDGVADESVRMDAERASEKERQDANAEDATSCLNEVGSIDRRFIFL
jgi:hypothetical protein